jgi:hypothetical protein
MRFFIGAICDNVIEIHYVGQPTLLRPMLVVALKKDLLNDR